MSATRRSSYTHQDTEESRLAAGQLHVSVWTAGRTAYEPGPSRVRDEVRHDEGVVRRANSLPNLLRIGVVRPNGRVSSVLVGSCQPRHHRIWAEFEVRPITVNLAPLPAPEPEMIPEPFRAWVEDIATRAWTLVEYVIVAVIVAISGLIGSRIGIKPKEKDSWIVVPNLWGMVVGPPGVLKSPMVKEGMGLLRRLAARSRDAVAWP